MATVNHLAGAGSSYTDIFQVVRSHHLIGILSEPLNLLKYLNVHIVEVKSACTSSNIWQAKISLLHDCRHGCFIWNSWLLFNEWNYRILFTDGSFSKLVCFVTDCINLSTQ